MDDTKISNESWNLYLHNKSEHMSGYDWNRFNLKPKYQYTLSSRTKSFRLLPRPYRTDCYEYSQSSPFTSRKACIRHCKVKEAMNRCGHFYRDIDVFEGEQNAPSFQSKDINCVRNLTLKEYCSKKCPKQDCFKQHKEVFLLENVLMSGKPPTNRIYLFIPFEPKTTFYHKPSLGIIELFCYLASTVSLWFGFSMVALLFSFQDVINTYIRPHTWIYRINTTLLAKLSTIISTLLWVLIITGCSWESNKLLQLYLSYPTKIQILTEFDLYENDLASFSICRNIGNDHHGKSSNLLFNYYKNIGIDKEISFYLKEEEKLRKLNNVNYTMMISSNYFCHVARGIT